MNYFVLLELSPDETDENKINEIIDKKILEWQQNSNISKEYLLKIPDIKNVMLDKKLREQMSKEFIEIKKDKLKDLYYDIIIRTINRDLKDSDINELYLKYKCYDIDKNYIKEIYDSKNSSFNKNFSVQLISYLKELKINDASLYNYLNIKNDDNAYFEINKRYNDILKKENKTNIDEIKINILSLAKDIFYTKNIKAKYDDWLSFSYNIKFNELISDALTFNKKLDNYLLYTLIDIAEKIFNICDSKNYIINNCKYNKFNIDENIYLDVSIVKEKILLNIEKPIYSIELKKINKQDNKEIDKQKYINNKKINESTDYINKISNLIYQGSNEIQKKHNDRFISYQKHPDSLVNFIYIIFSILLLIVSMFLNQVNNSNEILYRLFVLLLIPVSIINIIRAFVLYQRWNNMCLEETYCKRAYMKIEKLIKEYNIFIDNVYLGSKDIKDIKIYTDRTYEYYKAFRNNYDLWFKHNNNFNYQSQGYFKLWILYSSLYTIVCIVITFL